MGRVLCGFGVVLAGLALLLQPAAADDKKDDKGFVQLFNGKDLTGWKIHDKPSKDILEVVTKKKDGKVIAFEGKLKGDKTEPLWWVEDGVLIGSGPASHLFSARDNYENFVYRVEAMINDKGNSGQYFRTQFGPGFPKGYEAQINSTHGDPQRTGSLYGIVKVTKQLHKPDTWFTQEVTAVGDHIVIKVNGETVVDTKDTKFKKGHFALQQHNQGSVVKFKKIEVKELPSPKSTSN
jgi:hypothetical protein